MFSLFVSEEMDKVELIYTKFVSLIKSDQIIHTLLPISEGCDVSGKSVDASEDEFFRLTTREGKLTNSQILRAVQESYASDLAGRMNATSNATDNAGELKKNFNCL
ncbi:unnamed protein product [Fraxinus pennsylvanica]|uniref:F-ATPase gamma subunit n=1 Tax=Fraxinus pennsylvanica TaxID=56036 RepID=A0AAD1YW54_9LAMI|nr:unnamed protein product [Fraxinus pennsylvanica]